MTQPTVNTQPTVASTTTFLTEDIVPNQTLYINNINDKVKIDGIDINYLLGLITIFFRAKTITLLFVLTIW